MKTRCFAFWLLQVIAGMDVFRRIYSIVGMQWASLTRCAARICFLEAVTKPCVRWLPTTAMQQVIIAHGYPLLNTGWPTSQTVTNYLTGRRISQGQPCSLWNPKYPQVSITFHSLTSGIPSQHASFSAKLSQCMVAHCLFTLFESMTNNEQMWTVEKTHAYALLALAMTPCRWTFNVCMWHICVVLFNLVWYLICPTSLLWLFAFVVFAAVGTCRRFGPCPGCCFCSSYCIWICMIHIEVESVIVQCFFAAAFGWSCDSSFALKRPAKATRGGWNIQGKRQFLTVSFVRDYNFQRQSPTHHTWSLLYIEVKMICTSPR